jgi:UPF0755 protein
MAVNETFDAPGDLNQSKTVIIPPGGTQKVALVLAQDAVIAHPLIFRAAAWFTRAAGPIHAGEFLIPARSSIHQILDILRTGAPVEHRVTIPEGLTAAQIARLINATPDATGTVLPPAEASLLPQTYDFTLGTNRAEILRRAAQAMRDAVAKAWAARDQTVPLTSPNDAVTLASIVQEETPIPAELPEIAAVYENRLAKGMKLQADPTVIYATTQGATASGVAITHTDLATPSPYNTYAIPGLPPGPICAPGIAAIQAVLHPARTGALYFVATGNGGHVFATTYQDQLANIASHRVRERHGAD